MFFVLDCICKLIFTKVINNCQEVRIDMIIVILLSSSTLSAWYLSNHEFDLKYITILFLILIILNIGHKSKCLQKNSHPSYIFGQYTFSLFDKYSPISHFFKKCFCWFICSIKKISYNSFLELFYMIRILYVFLLLS